MNVIANDQSGVIAAVNTGKGKTVAADEAVIEIYPDDAMRINVSVPEDDLSRVKPGTTVQCFLGDDDTDPFTGIIEKISLLPNEDTAYGTNYTVSIIPESVDPLRYGLTILVLIP